MHFIFTVPVWVGIIIWIIQASAKRGAKSNMIQREIISPDGRKVTMVVPANEPPAVSIAKLYPGGVVPEHPGTSSTHTPLSGPPIQYPRQPLEVLPSPDYTPADNRPWKWIVITGLVVIVFITIMNIHANRSDTTASQDLPVTLLPAVTYSVTPSPILPHVTLKTGANLRVGPSRTAAVLRVLRQGDVLTKFGEENHWLRVGNSVAEGWIAESVVAQ